MPSATTAQAVVTNVLTEIGVTGIGDTPASEYSELVLGKLNRLLDRMNVQSPVIYRTVFNTYTLTANLAPHTIGPSGATWTASVRPVKIVGANLVLSGSPAVRSPIAIRDFQWWQDQRVRAVTSSIPTDLYYDPKWANGELNFWPVPDTAYTVELLSGITFTAMVLADSFSFPPGYEDLITLTLEEDCLSAPFAVPADVAQDIRRRAQQVRADVAAPNFFTPNLCTRDGGMPGGAGSAYDFRTGMIR